MSQTDQQHRNQISDEKFAFPKQEKEPIHDAAHVRNAIARFNQVEGVTESERDAAWKRIQGAARKFGVSLEEKDWRELSHGGKAKS
jgi:cell division protein FtsX